MPSPAETWLTAVACTSTYQWLVFRIQGIGGLSDETFCRVHLVQMRGHDIATVDVQLIVASLCLCCRRSYVDMPAPTVSSYTFGSPRVGNALFAGAYNMAVPDTWRVTNSQDYVPTVPKLLGYAHVDHHVLLDGKSSYSILGAHDVHVHVMLSAGTVPPLQRCDATVPESATCARILFAMDS